MHFVITAETSKEEIEKISKKLWPGIKANDKAGFNARKYNGALKIKGDALAIQKKLRNGWERTIS